jgi:hypothetical protein
MTWLDKLKLARKRFTAMKNWTEDHECTEEEHVELAEAIILMTEAMEEIGRASKVPLIDWDKPQP